ncbi:unnamed protein product, partial [Mesorhabditis spiculigera]
MADAEAPSPSPRRNEEEDEKHREVEPFLKHESAPVDKNNLVYLIVLFHGIGTLMPWNMFITIADSYFVNYKMIGEGGKNWYSLNFMYFLGIFSQLPNLILNLINIFVPVKGELTPRITISLTIVGAVVAFTDLFVFIDTAAWIPGFFWLTMISIAVLNGANGIYQNSIYGLASDFPFKYTNAVVIGNNLCGTLVAIFAILAVLVTDNKAYQAFGYFTVSLLTIIGCLFSFFKLKSLRYYQYHNELGNANRAKDDSGPASFNDYLETLKQGWPQFMNVFLVFFVTLTIFPNMMVFINPHTVVPGPNGTAELHYDFILPESQYMNFCVFLLFNIFAFFGSLTANYVQFPSHEYLWIMTWARVLFIPFFMYCNYYPLKRTLAVFFPSYYTYIVGAILMSFTSGYFSSLGMMYAPRVVDPSRARIAGMMAAFFLIFGIVSGLFFTMYVPRPRAPVAYNDVFIVAPKTVVRSTKKMPRNNTIWVMFEGNQWTDVVMSIGWDGEDKQKLFKEPASSPAEPPLLGAEGNILPMGIHRLIMCENGRLSTERFDAPDPTPAVDFHIHAVVVTKFSLNWTEQTRSVELPFEIDLVDDGCLQIVGNYTELHVYENVGRLDRESRKVAGDQTTTTYWPPEWTPLRVETLVGDLYRMVTPIELSIDGLQWKPDVFYDVTKLCLIPTRQPPYETIRQELNDTDDMLLAELAEVEEDEEGYDDFLDDLFDEESEHDAEQFDC